jgi:dUTP pyrophosphatase
MSDSQLQVWFEPLYDDVEAPRRSTPDSAGYDLRAYLLGSPVQIAAGSVVVRRTADTSGTIPFIELLPEERAIIPLGFRAAVPHGYEAQIRPRSGVSFRQGLDIPNAPGTIDSDYRGEWGVIVRNASGGPLRIHHGDRIAQVVFAAVAHFPFVQAPVDDTARGAGGFGSTGAR